MNTLLAQPLRALHNHCEGRRHYALAMLGLAGAVALEVHQAGIGFGWEFYRTFRITSMMERS